MEQIDNTNPWEAFIDRSELSNEYEYKPKRAAEILGINSRSRKRELVCKRYLFWYFAKRINKKLPYKVIGTFTGGHDNATVLRAVNMVSDPFIYRQDLKKYEDEVLRIVNKTDFTDDRKKR